MRRNKKINGGKSEEQRSSSDSDSQLIIQDTNDTSHQLVNPEGFKNASTFEFSHIHRALTF